MEGVSREESRDGETGHERERPTLVYDAVEIESIVFVQNIEDLSRELEKVGRHDDATAVRQAAKKLEKHIR